MGADYKESEDGEDGRQRKTQEIDEAIITKKLNRNILTVFFVMTVLCYVDRTNLAFAALQLNRSLGFTDQVYGLGSGIFFIGYSLFQVPSNMILVKMGAPTWLSVIVISWGVVATSFAWLKTPMQFYILRFLLGVAECGTFPGMWYYLSLFYSEKDMGMAYAWITTGTALSQVIGSPIAAALLSLDGWLGLEGWQWLFLAEGLPTILLGTYLPRCICDSPAKASFLTPQERNWLVERNANAEGGAKAGAGSRCWDAVFNWRTYHVAAISALDGTVKNALLYWSPLIIHTMIGDRRAMQVTRELSEVELSLPAGDEVIIEESDSSAAYVALMTALPFGLAAAWMLLVARSSQRTGERRLHSCIPYLLGAGALIMMAFFLGCDPPAAFLSLLGATIIWGPAGIIYGLPATFLQGPAAATGIALINSLANVGGIVGPYITGHLKAAYGSYVSAVAVLACIMLAAAFLASIFPLSNSPSGGQMQHSQTPKAAQSPKFVLLKDDHRDLEKGEAVRPRKLREVQLDD